MLSVNNSTASIVFYAQLGSQAQYESDDWTELTSESSTIELALRQSSSNQPTEERCSGIGFVVDDYASYSQQLIVQGLGLFIDFLPAK